MTEGGGAVQGRDVSELFRWDEQGKVHPVLHRVEVPVRAIVIPIVDFTVAQLLIAAVKTHFEPLFPPNSLWLQNFTLLHSTLYHASTHLVGFSG